jgi:predicted DNA-binding transcriptional regulator AlpA
MRPQAVTIQHPTTHETKTADPNARETRRKTDRERIPHQVILEIVDDRFKALVARQVAMIGEKPWKEESPKRGPPARGLPTDAAGAQIKAKNGLTQQRGFDDYLDLRAVQRLTGGKSRSTLWRWARAGLFPKPYRIGPNSIAWRRSDIDAWMKSRVAIASSAATLQEVRP